MYKSSCRAGVSPLISVFWTLLLLLFVATAPPLKAQTVQVGQGSYSLTLPPGALGPTLASGQPAVPLISDSFTQPVQTSNFWSSILFPFFGDPHSAPLYAHPLSLKAAPDGLQLGYTANAVVDGRAYSFPYTPHLIVGVQGMSAPDTKVLHYGDWTVTGEWQGNGREMLATLGHGLPFVYFEISGGSAQITPTSAASVWHQQGEVLGVTVGGEHYALFAPTGSQWQVGGQFISTLNGQGFLSVAVLPDNTPETLEFFRARAYAFVTDTHVNWEYDEANALLRSTYTFETELRDTAPGNLNETLSALYRHQWLSVQQAVTPYRYNSPRGEMKLFAGNSFTTERRFAGVLPSMPDAGAYNRAQMLQLVNQVAQENLPGGPTYQNGKDMARFAHLIHIADQLGEPAAGAKAQLMNKLKARVQNWLTAGGDQQYVYNEMWNVLTGYPSDHGANTQINDHHFHHAYLIMSAATIARFDPEWAAQDNWGGMVNLLVHDANNWDRDNEMFPFLRSFDVYAGHSWASGHGAFGDGNNQESSSEAMNFASAAILWGEITQQPEIRDLGIYLYTTEAAAIHQYWFDVDEEVFPPGYGYNALGIVWGNKGNHSTWFGQQPEFIHGINILPVHSGSFYLGEHPEYVIQNFNAAAAAAGGQLTLWKDIFWKYLALADADQALAFLQADPNYDRFDGNSRAHTLHWIHNLRTLGRVDFTVHADIPTFGVFINADGGRSYVAYNAGDSPRLVTFSDGFSMEVPPRELAAEIAAEIPDTEVKLPIHFDNELIDWNGTFGNFDGGVSTVIENPDQSGINTTSRVARMVKNDGAPWGGSLIPLSEPFNPEQPVKIQVWAPRANTSLLFKIENNADNSRNFEVNQTIPASGEWVEMTFDLSGANPDFTYDNIVLIFDLGTPGNGSADFTWFYDNIAYVSPTSTGPEDEVPARIALHQNYPNPFNPATTIRYELPEAAVVRLNVYDLTGRLVATLVDGQQAAGSHNIRFDAAHLSSGIYLYRLQSGGQTLSRTLTLLK